MKDTVLRIEISKLTGFLTGMDQKFEGLCLIVSMKMNMIVMTRICCRKNFGTYYFDINIRKQSDVVQNADKQVIPKVKSDRLRIENNRVWS
jgi:hypothetical protein